MILSPGLFGATQPSTGLFGGTAAPATGGLFGSTAAKPSFGGFGQAATATPAFGSTGTNYFPYRRQTCETNKTHFS